MIRIIHEDLLAQQQWHYYAKNHPSAIDLSCLKYIAAMYKYSKNALMLCSYSPKKPNQKASGRGNNFTQLHEYFVVCCLQRTVIGARSFTRVHIAILNEGTNCPTFALRFLSISTLPPFAAAINVPDINGWTICICRSTLLHNIFHIYLFFGIKVNLVLETVICIR